MQRLLKLSISIITNELYDNDALREGWLKVYENVIGQVEFSYVQLATLKAIQELIDRKSKFERRKLGHRLLFKLVMNCGEAALDENKTVLRMVLQVCGDPNYKFRMDGAIFFREYLEANFETLKSTPRLAESYIPELCEMCNDEEIYIRIEAFTALSFVLETMD
jgi:hypothetical protein